METQVLTKKEEQVLKLVLQELTTAQIAIQLRSDHDEIEAFRKSIEHKLGSSHLLVYVKYALQHNIHI